MTRWNKGVALSDSKGGVVGQRPEWIDEQRQGVDDLIDEYRVALHDSLNGLTEGERVGGSSRRRRRCSASSSNATFIEGVWFDQAITGRSSADTGIASTVDGSFTLRPTDTIASV